eukprot:8316718-Pyramimonas_sp.AAC.1
MATSYYECVGESRMPRVNWALTSLIKQMTTGLPPLPPYWQTLKATLKATLKGTLKATLKATLNRAPVSPSWRSPRRTAHRPQILPSVLLPLPRLLEPRPSC